MTVWKWNYKGFCLYVVSILVTSLVVVTSCTPSATSPTPSSTYSPAPTPLPAEPEDTTPTPSPTGISQSENNDIEVCFEARWEYESLENNFTNEEVTGNKYWFAMMSNTPDETGEVVKGLALTLETELQFARFDEKNLTQAGPPTYEWAFGDVPPVAGFHPETPRVQVGFNKPGPFPVTFTPGFDVSRTADKTEFSKPDIQTLNIELTPREGTGVYTIWVGAGEDDSVKAAIVSPSTDEEQDILLDPDGRWLDISLEGLEVGMIYTYAVTVDVTPKVPNADFMPSVTIHHVEHVTSGTDTGSSTSHLVDEPEGEIGTWTWKADGSYVWHWGETLEKMVVFAKPNQVYEIGITQVVTHPDLDSTRQGFIDQMAEEGFIEGVNVEYHFRNPDNDLAEAESIAEEFVFKEMDLILSISTPSSKPCVEAAKGTGIPIVFAAVTDPVAYGIVSKWEAPREDNVTGVSDESCVNYTWIGEEAGRYAARILKGDFAGDIPVVGECP